MQLCVLLLSQFKHSVYDIELVPYRQFLNGENLVRCVNYAKIALHHCDIGNLRIALVGKVPTYDNLVVLVHPHLVRLYRHVCQNALNQL